MSDTMESMGREVSEKHMMWTSLLHSPLVENEGRQGGERQSYPCLSDNVIDLLQSDYSHEAVVNRQYTQKSVGHVASDPFSIISTIKEHDNADFDNGITSCPRISSHQGSKDAENAEGGKHSENCFNPQVRPQSLDIMPDRDDKYSSCAISDGYVQNETPYDIEEACRHQHGTLRCCRQFGGAEFPDVASDKNRCSRKMGDRICSSMSRMRPTELENMKTPHMESRVTSVNPQPTNLSRPTTFRLSLVAVSRQGTSIDKSTSSVRNNGKSTMSAPVASGIGLHLNSIVKVAQMDCKSNEVMQLEECPQRGSSPMIKRLLPPNVKSCSLPLSRSGQLSTGNNDDWQEIYSTVMESSTFQSSGMEPLNDLQQLELIEHQKSQCQKRKYALENAETFEEVNEASPKTKRMRTSHITEGGCKRCKCKKSKCLKLYCDCFAAGLYCAEPCTCQECFNKPEYEHIVLKNRKQIESRNPFAFTPKFVCGVSKSPLNSREYNKRATPSLIRHKKGCSCNKSECLKRYCECYQAGVGCSAGCRCKGCKNIFGVKEVSCVGSHEMGDMTYGSSGNETSCGKLAVVENGNMLQSDRCNPVNISPIAPGFQPMEHRKDIPQCQLPASSHIKSPRVEILSYSDNSPRSLSNIIPRYLHVLNGHKACAGEGTSDIVPYTNELETITEGAVGQLLPRGDEGAGCDINPLPNTPLRISAPSLLPNNIAVSQFQPSPSACSLSHDSISKRLSPITPLRRLGESKFFRKPDSLSRLNDISDDDTPDILKDHSNSIKTVKTSSPNQKRISPPHMHDQRSSSSMGLRGGRKFILRSISSIPPLPPGSKANGWQQ